MFFRYLIITQSARLFKNQTDEKDLFSRGFEGKRLSTHSHPRIYAKQRITNSVKASLTSGVNSPWRAPSSRR